ncbi:hypothetical protein KDK77_10725, partial [bacterium]|nr:hypothetical protein [bacterium]
SLRLLIADVTRSTSSIRISPIFRSARINQLGHALHADKIISSESIAQSQEILSEYLRYIALHNCITLTAVATSVFRDSLNGSETKELFEKQINIPITILTGAQEARLFFEGICVNRSIDPKLVYGCFDIGGGSTECIVSHGKTIVQCTSLPIGCLRSKHGFLHKNPPSIDEISLLTRHIHDIIKKNIVIAQPVSSSFAFGGTITCLARIICKKSAEETENIILTKEQLLTTCKHFSLLSDTEIGITFGAFLDKGRETVLRTGTIIALELMNHFNLSTITVTNQGILFGTLKQLFESI